MFSTSLRFTVRESMTETQNTEFLDVGVVPEWNNLSRVRLEKEKLGKQGLPRFKIEQLE